MEKVTVIIFTFKRAILLDSALEFLIKNFKNLNYPIYIIYHVHPEHKESYKLLKNKWDKKKIFFYERKKITILSLLKYLFFHPLNFLWLIKWFDIFRKRNNFKFILEKIILKAKTKYVCMMPDDQIFFKKTIIPDKVFKILNNKKKDYFYRFFTGNHFKKFNFLPKKLKVTTHQEKSLKFFEWSHNNLKFDNAPLWNYRFTIEGTVFYKDTLIKLLGPYLYHNPITLEAIGLWESRFRGFFKKGISSQVRTAAGYQINSVQNYVYHHNYKFSPKLLMKFYLKGYSLFINQNDFKKEYFDVIPKEIFLLKNRKKINFNKLII